MQKVMLLTVVPCRGIIVVYADVIALKQQTFNTFEQQSLLFLVLTNVK